ncbi:Solute carrier family 13 member 4 [Orchesella cincta]|uniref:Solute carrier family 13 member 4 n=1 Tax=Orchesella cincta TaxID=48709 RepID=A0A1D2NM45_ORCCI|nr:Solute carrier family 13 member 4 [Orchesella cincta]
MDFLPGKMFSRKFIEEGKLRLKHNWRLVVAILVLVVFSPLVWAFDNHATELKTAYVILIMGIFWIFEVIPLAITSLFPVVFFPMLGVQDAADVSKNYMRESNMIFLGSIILALGIEYSGLHIRGALRVISICGTNPAFVLFGTVFITAMLSMWISDSSCTTMLIPIVCAITAAMFREEQPEEEDDPFANNVDSAGLFPPHGRRSSQLRNRRASHVFANSALNRGSVDNFTRRSRRASRLSTHSIRRESGVHWEDTVGGSTESGIGGMHSRRNSTDHAAAAMPASGSSLSVHTHSNMSIIQEGIVTPEKEHSKHHVHMDEGGAGEIVIKVEEVEDEDFMLRTSIKKMLLVAVAISANVGGTASLVGTGPIKVFKELAKKYKLDKNPNLVGPTFFTWIGFNLPHVLVNVVLIWIFLLSRYFSISQFKKWSGGKERQKAKEYIHEEYAKLGPITSHEIGVLIVFILVVVLWLLRDPQFFPGWDAIDKTVSNGDSTAAMVGVILLFIIPKDWSFLTKKSGEYEPSEKYEALLNWKFVSANAPWGYLLHIGSGYAIADAADYSGLSDDIGDVLDDLKFFPKPVLLLVVLIFTSLITEVVSSTAAANLILPILFSVSCKLQLHPIFLTMPAAVTASYGFMLPISSPANAIVFATGELKVKEMMVNGVILNIVCVLVLYGFVLFYGEWIFGFSTFQAHLSQIPYYNCSRGSVSV